MVGRPYKCPSCGSLETVWKGCRRRVGGKVRLRKCNKCGKRFTSRCFIREVNESGIKL